MSLDHIRTLVQPDLANTDKFLHNELTSTIPLINNLVDYIISNGGKRIRPLLVLLASQAFDEKGTRPVQLAAAIELIHTATLLHDDVVDNSTLRRGNQTANNIWGNEASVLVGDFLYSRAFQLIVKLQNLKVMNIFANATNIIAEGEVLQLVNCHRPETTEAEYYDVILRKTGKLFEVAASLGAALTNRSETEFKAMEDYGLHLGIAYQLTDDALDYTSSAAEMGKNIGNDLTEGKPTLPLIYAMKEGTKAETKLIKTAIKEGLTGPIDDIVTIIHRTQAIDYTLQAAKSHSTQAIEALRAIPASAANNALVTLANFIVERKY